MFDASQPPLQKRSLNYTELEDKILIKAWESVSLDAVIGNDQTDKKYWQRVDDKCHRLMPEGVSSPRSLRSLQGRWDVIKAIQSGCLEEVRNYPPSGCTIDD